jgi:hypothetical protein
MEARSLIFISHASSDESLAALLEKFLREAGLSSDDCFRSTSDASISYGGNDLEEIYLAMESSKIFVEIITPTFLERPRCLQEVGFITARQRMSSRKELPNHDWIRVLPLVAPPLTIAEVISKLDRAQAPTMDNAKAINVFTSALLEAVIRAGRQVSHEEWRKSAETFSKDWLQTSFEIDAHINKMLRQLQPISDLYLELIIREPARIPECVAGLAPGIMRSFARTISNYGSPETGLLIAAQITRSDVERFEAAREAVIASNRPDFVLQALPIAYGLNDTYKKHMVRLLSEYQKYVEGIRLALSIDNAAVRQHPFLELTSDITRNSPFAIPKYFDWLQELFMSFESSHRMKLLDLARSKKIDMGWLNDYDNS